MKKINSYFPIWFLLMVPPILLLTLTYNFVMVFVGLLLILFMINKKNIFKNNFKDIFKLWGVSLLVDMVSLICLALPEVFYKVKFIKDNLITPLETNPYSNIYSIIYLVLIISIDIIIILLFAKKIVIKKYELEGTKKYSSFVILVLVLLPYLFFIPSNRIIKNEYNSLSEYKGTSIKNKSKIATLLKHIKTSKNISSYVIDTHKEPYTLHIYVHDIEENHQVFFERDAASIFNVVDEVNEIKFYLNDKEYIYTINSINRIFKDVKSLNLFQIYERYKDPKFDDYNYLGRIEKYDVFDTSEYCELNKQLLFQLQHVNYYIKCSSAEKILLYDKNMSISIKKALENNLIDEYAILNSTIDSEIEGDDSFENTN